VNMAGCPGNKPHAKIKKILNCENDLHNDWLNLIIWQINSFIAASFKASNKDELDPNTIAWLGKLVGINLSWKQMMDIKYFESREFLSQSKEKLLKLLYGAINKSNKNNEPDKAKLISPFHQYWFHVGKGNNYTLVR